MFWKGMGRERCAGLGWGGLGTPHVLRNKLMSAVSRGQGAGCVAERAYCLHCSSFRSRLSLQCQASLSSTFPNHSHACASLLAPLSRDQPLYRPPYPPPCPSLPLPLANIGGLMGPVITGCCSFTLHPPTNGQHLHLAN